MHKSFYLRARTQDATVPESANIHIQIRFLILLVHVLDIQLRTTLVVTPVAEVLAYLSRPKDCPGLGDPNTLKLFFWTAVGRMVSRSTIAEMAVSDSKMIERTLDMYFVK